VFARIFVQNDNCRKFLSQISAHVKGNFMSLIALDETLGLSYILK